MENGYEETSRVEILAKNDLIIFLLKAGQGHHILPGRWGGG